jgi:hypothetical protein
MPLLPEGASILLVLPLRLQDLPKLHAGKSVGDVVQRHHLGMPRLRRPERLRQPVTGAPAELTMSPKIIVIACTKSDPHGRKGSASNAGISAAGIG